MKKLGIILTTLMLFVIVGCTKQKVENYNYNYRGENELWSAEYNVDGKSKITEKDGKINYYGDANYQLTVNYKKDLSELSSAKHLEISYRTGTKAGNLTQDFDDNNPVERVYTLKSSSTNGAIETKDDVIEVTINLDGNIQTIQLKN
ncbi:hypothetical protein NNC19_05815 [Clostridium sp. SHJSY1]|uniref:hypothetical protein n=1 Tax=Clostridium sp. SHJSY1 TaxID=2942483 RepID=UPI0028745728|nr:hypothetical protein [Clostridium sp. SHJSY1]MDS0525191.1 hypothetical protein [Clostridium sp. SHJSY1]